MREPKFKAYEKNLKQIIKIDSIDWELRQVNVNGAWRTFDEVILFQSTGLIDRNGVEIYECDVIKVYSGEFWMHKDRTDLSNATDSMIGVVEWSEIELQYRVDNRQHKPGWWPTLKNNPGRAIYEVVGNFETMPEMMEESVS